MARGTSGLKNDYRSTSNSVLLKKIINEVLERGKKSINSMGSESSSSTMILSLWTHTNKREREIQKGRMRWYEKENKTYGVANLPPQHKVRQERKASLPPYLFNSIVISHLRIKMINFAFTSPPPKKSSLSSLWVREERERTHH